MNSRRVITRVLMLCALFILPRSGFAQEAVLTGTITDSSGGVLPGVTITAVHTASGNNFVAVCAGNNQNVALRSDGSLISWGRDSYGAVSQTPTSHDFIMASSGDVHSLALRSDSLMAMVLRGVPRRRLASQHLSRSRVQIPTRAPGVRESGRSAEDCIARGVSRSRPVGRVQSVRKGAGSRID